MIPPSRPTNSDSSRNWAPILERLWPTARRMPISDDRWITEMDITLAMPIPPTVSASKPAKSATCCRVLLAWAAAWSTSLGIWVETWSEPPRLMAVGMALAVAWVVPGCGADVELVGFTVGAEDVLGGPLGHEDGVVELGVQRDAGPSTPTTAKLVLLSWMVRASPGR